MSEYRGPCGVFEGLHEISPGDDCEECGGIIPHHRPGCSNEEGYELSRNSSVGVLEDYTGPDNPNADERHCSECFMLFSHAPDCSKKPKTGFATIHRSDDSDKEL